ncbi:MAG: TonB family protein [Candidatus Omnitrophota bacterium]
MKKNILYIVVIIFISIFLCLSFQRSDIAASEETQEVNLLIGGLEILEISYPDRVSVVDPTIADFDRITDTEIYLVGKGAGTTTLKIWEETGERTILIRVFAEDLIGLQERLKKLLGNFNINNLNLVINKDEGKVVVTGEFLEADMNRVDSVLSSFGDRIINLLKIAEEVALVQIDVQILELTKSAVRELGIDWLQSLQLREEPYSASTSSSGGVATTKDGTASLGKIFRVVEWSRDALTAKIRMLESQNKAKVLSRPKLVCLSGKEAEFVVGGEVPIVTTGTTSSGTTQTNVEYRQYGVVLKIKPVVSEAELINTEINTEISDIASWVTIGGSSYPLMETSTATTQLYLRDGETVFLAGLIKNSLSKDNISGIPLLMDIPLLGALFRWRDYSKTDTELVISVTPSIIRRASGVSQDEEKDSGKIEKTSAVVTEEPKQAIPSSISQYVRLVQAKIAEAIKYPEEARQFGWEGTVELNLHLISDGNLSGVSVKESSGYDIFDDAAIEATELQSPYPVFPASIETTDLWIDIPIAYRID